MALVVRSLVIEYGSLAALPLHLDSLAAIKALGDQLHQLSSYNEQGLSFVTPQAISAALNFTAVQTKIFLDLLASVVDPPELVQRAEGGDVILAVETYSLALFLCVHFYLREALKAETSDVWPSEYASWQQEPSSPMRMTARAWGRDASPNHKAHLPMMRQHLQQHLQLQEALVTGFSGFVARHAAQLLALVLNHPGQSPSKAAPQGMVSAGEVDRLGFLLAPAGLEEGRSGPLRGGGGGGPLEGGSPMDVCSTPFSEARVVISEHTPFFAAGATAAYAPLNAVVAWLADTLRPLDEGGPGGDMMLGSSPRGSPPRTSMFNRLVQVSTLACPTDVHGASRTTVVRGEDDFPSGRLRVLDCHDAVVYALAPLQYCLLSACSDCVVVLGAVGRVLRVERCERVQVVAATRCVTINTCHDCILYLGVNQQPLVLGDNRFVQLAPYASGYERLPEHMALAGVRPEPNYWDAPVALLPDHRGHHHNHGGHGGSPLGGSPLGGSPPGAPLASPAGAPGPAAPESMQISQPQSQQQQQQQQQQPQPGFVTPPSPGGLSEASSAGATTPLAAGLGSPGAAVGSPVPGTPAAVTLLPPAKLVPFFIPFRGGAGPMCGGPARAAPAPLRAGSVAPAGGASTSSAAAPSADSLSTFFGGGEGSAGAFPSSPFVLPAQYRAAWEERTRGAMEVKAAVKAANLDDGKKKELMAAIQSHFKEWLQSSGSMRQIYDLAKLERDESASSQLMNTL